MKILKMTLLALIFILLPAQIAWAQSPHAYFDWLSQQPEKIVSNAYRTQAEIDRDSPPKHRPNPNVRYDPDHDAARVTMFANKPGLGGAGQVWPSLDNSGYAKNPGFEITTGNLLFTWDTKWSSGFLNVKQQGLETYKCFQLARMGLGGEERAMEIRTRFVLSDPTYIAETDARTYVWSHPGERQPLGYGGCNGECQINGFDIQVNTWTRYWAFVDFDNGTFSLWMADENREPIKIFDKFSINYTSGLNAFWMEYNTSQTRTGPEIWTWNRNLSVLQNVSDVDAMVAVGANVGAGVSAPPPPTTDTTPPSPPTNLNAHF